MGNISMTYYTSFCISRFCPLLYIAACAPRINHFPASLLHEMKEFIMVTVGRCKAFTVIYLGEIDWFINTEWTVLCGGGSATHAAGCVERARLQYGGLSWASPVAAYRSSCVSISAHYLASTVSGPELGAGTLWQRTERFKSVHPYAFQHYGECLMTRPSDLTELLLRDTAKCTGLNYFW